MDTTAANPTGRDRMRELILYVAHACEDDRTFGAVKLNKILFYADFLAYRERGRSITEQEYQKLPQGPAPRCLVPLREEMVLAGDLIVREAAYFGRPQKRPIALRNPDLSPFLPLDIAVVDAVIRALWGKTARETSELSHEFWGWKLANMRETVPYEVALVARPDEYTDDELEYARGFRQEAQQLAGV